MEEEILTKNIDGMSRLKIILASWGDMYDTFHHYLDELEDAPVSVDNFPKVGYVDVVSHFHIGRTGIVTPKINDALKDRVESLLNKYSELCGYKRLEVHASGLAVEDLLCRINETSENPNCK